MKFNINEKVKVKLNEHGLKILKDQHDELRGWCPSIGEYREPKIDNDGFTEFQLWNLMEKFGSHITLGSIPPFETEIEIPDNAKNEGLTAPEGDLK